MGQRLTLGLGAGKGRRPFLQPAGHCHGIGPSARLAKGACGGFIGHMHMGKPRKGGPHRARPPTVTAFGQNRFPRVDDGMGQRAPIQFAQQRNPQLAAKDHHAIGPPVIQKGADRSRPCGCRAVLEPDQQE